jgi:hypothetical protein
VQANFVQMLSTDVRTLSPISCRHLATTNLVTSNLGTTKQDCRPVSAFVTAIGVSSKQRVMHGVCDVVDIYHAATYGVAAPARSGIVYGSAPARDVRVF